MGDVSLRLLGGFEAAVDGVIVPESAWRLKKARELVKLLALAPGHRLHREQAMDVLWRDRGPAAAANNLHQAVHVARRALDPGAIGSRNEVLSLVATIDVDRFELAAADARLVKTPAAYRAALALYAGELLPENRYDDWAETRREELAALVVELEQEFSAFGPTIGFGLPANTSSFVGRERELAELQSLLGQTRLLTLCGTGGTGKTRLALELARGAEPAFEAGAALVELAELTDPRLIPDAVAASLDLRALPGQDLVDAVIGFLAPRRLLLVLDNCEHVLAATASLVDALLRAAPQVTIVATSREPLRVPGEVVFRVPSLDIPDPEQALPPTQLREYEAVSLFVERAAAAAPGFVLDGENADDVARICLRLDGLPLALELAAGRVGALSPAAIAERLDDRFRLLRAGSLAGPTRQQTLSATLQWSHDLLEADERMLFRRLAIFAGSFELEAAEEVGAADDDLETSRIADLLARLVEKSLVAVGEAGRGRRYRLLETVRMYARERLDEAGEWPALAERHARWALALAEREHGSPRLDRDAANLRAALGYLLQQGSGDALVLAIALLPFWLRRIDLEEARRSFAAVARSGSRADGASSRGAARRRGDRVPQRHARPGLRTRRGELRRRLRDRRHASPSGGRCRSLGEFGIASDSVDEAVLWLERALALARSEGFAAAEAIGVHSLGVAHWILGDLASAESLVAESIELFRALEGTPDTIPSPLNIAEIRMSQPGGRPGLRHSLRGHAPAVRSRFRATRPSATRSRTRPGSRASAATSIERGRCSTKALPVSRRHETTRGSRRFSSVGRTSRSTEGELAEARTSARAARSSCARLSDRRGRGLVALRPRARRDRQPAITPAPSSTSPRHATSSGAPATAGGSRARSGGRPTSPSNADASTTRRPRSRRRARFSLRRSASAGSRAPSPGSPRLPRSAATPSVPSTLLADARRRYAARRRRGRRGERRRTARPPC